MRKSLIECHILESSYKYVIEDLSDGCKVDLWYSNSHRTMPHTSAPKIGNGSPFGCGITPFSTANLARAYKILESRYRLI